MKHVKTIIGIIGASGNMGSAISTSLAKAGHRLVIYSRDETKTDELTGQLKKASSKAQIDVSHDAGELAERSAIIILAVPYDAEKALADELKESTQGKIVISISNPLNENYDGLLTDGNTSAAEELQNAIPAAKVVKTFNTVFAGDFNHPNIDGKQIDTFVAGDDEQAVQEVAEIVKSMGINPLLSGRLSTSRTLESMQLLLIQLNMKNNYNWVAGWKILHN